MRNKKVYIRLIVTYLIVFMIPLVLNIFLLEDIADATQENICDSVLTNLNHVQEIVENNFQEIDMIVEKLSGSSSVRYVGTQMDEQDKYVEVSRIRATQDQMGAVQIQTFVEEFYLYFHQSDMVISPDHVFLDGERSADFFCYDKIPWEEWQQILEKSYSQIFFPEAESRQNKTSQNMLLYLSSLRTETGVKGTFVFPIKSKAIQELLKDVYVVEDGWAYVLDRTGQLLTGVPSSGGTFELISETNLAAEENIRDAEINGQKVKIIKTVSPDRELVFVAVLPMEYIIAQINHARRQTVSLMFFVLLVGVTAILAVSWHRGRKIDQMLQVLFRFQDDSRENYKEKSIEVKGDELTYISNSLISLMESNADYRKSLKKQEPITRALLLEQLLMGIKNHTVKSLKELGVDLTNSRLLVMGYQILELQAVNGESYVGDSVIYRQMLLQRVSELVKGKTYSCNTDMDAGAVICTLEEGQYDRAIFKQEMEQLCSFLWSTYGVEIRVVLGDVCESPQQISKIYDQICEILQYWTLDGGQVVFGASYRETKSYYYYPTALEERLVNAVRTGNTEGMREQMRQVYQINVLEREISPAMMHFLVNDLQCTVLKVLHSLHGQIVLEEETVYGKLEQLSKETDILLRFNRLNAIFSYICDKVREETDESNERLKTRIEAYISANYTSADMGLAKIAEEFGYAGSYFSKLFKDYFHENFVNYLERVRVEKICQLLKTEETMEQIAAKTGYNSVHVMRSAFKRMKGMTPKEYKRINREALTERQES